MDCTLWEYGSIYIHIHRLFHSCATSHHCLTFKGGGKTLHASILETFLQPLPLLKYLRADSVDRTNITRVHNWTDLLLVLHSGATNPYLNLLCSIYNCFVSCWELKHWQQSDWEQFDLHVSRQITSAVFKSLLWICYICVFPVPLDLRFSVSPTNLFYKLLPVVQL